MIKHVNVMVKLEHNQWLIFEHTYGIESYASVYTTDNINSGALLPCTRGDLLGGPLQFGHAEWQSGR